jgi:hypothetical protein
MLVRIILLLTKNYYISFGIIEKIKNIKLIQFKICNFTSTLRY